MNSETIKAYAGQFLTTIKGWAVNPLVYAQVGFVIGAVIIARLAARQLVARIAWFNEPEEGASAYRLRRFLSTITDLVFPLLAVAILAVAVKISTAVFGSAWLVVIAQGVAVVYLLYSVITRFVPNPLVRKLCIWIAIPLATLKVFGWLDDAALLADGIAFQVGNIRLSILTLFKAGVAGGILFWLGRVSNSAGQKAIRGQDAIDPPTRELFAKLFEIILYVVIFILLLQVLGLDLTALTVFGGALGVGLGFGLQQIASNFISGIIILLERSIGVGDYIEMENGKGGTLKQLNMRSSTLETFDGKEIMVPNEKFITTMFTNWTRDDPRQRYEVEFSVAYDTDLHAIPPLIEKAVATHPRVLQEPEPVDCELRGFGDSGVEFAVEFWVSGLDDGKNKFSSDVLFLVWDALKKGNITIPFPQRDVHLVEPGPKLAIRRKDSE